MIEAMAEARDAYGDLLEPTEEDEK